ncbi:thioredoxin [Patescibacteria group bacterium]|nr:MAG: thioredoxin [Patescibacteria group bacterium]
MKNILFAVVGVVLFSGLGYAVIHGQGAGSASLAAVVTANDASYRAGAYQDFSRAAYDRALADGKTVILDFHADWCPTCRANEPVIRRTFELNTDANLVGFKVNYDTEVALKRTFHVTSQSTIIKTSVEKIPERLGPGPVTAESLAFFIRS